VLIGADCRRAAEFVNKLLLMGSNGRLRLHLTHHYLVVINGGVIHNAFARKGDDLQVLDFQFRNLPPSSQTI
jgi:hypothetical protein